MSQERSDANECVTSKQYNISAMTPAMIEDGQRDPPIKEHDQVYVQSGVLPCTLEEEHSEQTIPPLVSILDKSEHFECKITLKCSLTKVVETIVDELSKNPRELQWFRKESPFGHFLDVPTYYTHSSQMMWLLLLRQAKCERKNEMWFVVNGKPIRFSLLEYVLISGLRGSEYPVGYKKQSRSQYFKNRHFPENTIVTIGDVEKKLVEMGTESRKKRLRKDGGEINMEKLKMAMLLFASAVLYQGSANGIDTFLLGMVDNMDMFIQFPWGKSSFIYLRKQLGRSIKEKAQKLLKDGMTSSTMTYYGFLFPLAILAYECIPAIASVYAQHRKNIAKGIPRIHHWQTFWKLKNSPSYGDIVTTLGKSQDIIGLLTPTDEELQAPYMQGFSEIPDGDNEEVEPNAVLRELTRQLVSGRSITWHDDSVTIPNVDHVEEVEACVDVGATSHVEATNETCVRRRGSPNVDTTDISNTEEVNISSPSRLCQPEVLSMETPFWVSELKKYLDQKVSSLESNFTQKFSSLEYKLENDLRVNLVRLETKIDSLIVAKVGDNRKNNQDGPYFDGNDTR